MTMPRCVLLVSGADHDVTNLLTEAQLIEFMSRSSTSCCLTDDNEDQAQAQTQAQAENDSTITLEEVLREYEQYQQQQAQHLQQQAHDWSTCSALYPNLNDPCNKRMIQDLPPLKWEAVPLVRQVDHSTSGQSQEQADKFAEFYDLQQRDLERLQQQHHLQQQLDLQEQAEADFDMTMTSLPQRAYSAPLHTPAGGLAPVSPHHTLSHMNNPYNHSVINHSHNHMMMNMNMNDNHSVMPPSFTAQTTMGSVYPRSVHHRFGGGDDGDGTHSLASPHRRHSPPRPSLPPVRRQQRHSTTAVPGDIESSSSGLRPRVNYKALYGRRGSSASSAATPPNLETSLSGFSMGGASIDDDGASMMSGGGSGGGQHHHHHHHDQDGAGCMMEESTTTATTMMDSSSLHQMPHHHHHPHHHYHHHHHQHPVMEEDDEEEPVPQEDHSESAPARTMEIAPNVHVQVRSSQETYKAVQSGDYTVATCFACCATIVCVNDAAYVLCPDCQVVSPLGFGAATNDASKKDDPYGIGTGLKREWVDEHVR